MEKGGISRLERGERSPSWETVAVLCDALGVDCTAFAVAPKDAPVPKRGRPRKDAEPPLEVKPARSKRGK